MPRKSHRSDNPEPRPANSPGRGTSTRDILRLLELRHARDIFVRECRNGPSQSRGHLRMDAWAMLRSWAASGKDRQVHWLVSDKLRRLFADVRNLDLVDERIRIARERVRSGAIRLRLNGDA